MHAPKGGERGLARVAAADAWMRAEGIASPERMTGLICRSPVLLGRQDPQIRVGTYSDPPDPERRTGFAFRPLRHVWAAP